MVPTTEMGCTLHGPLEFDAGSDHIYLLRLSAGAATVGHSLIAVLAFIYSSMRPEERKRQSMGKIPPASFRIAGCLLTVLRSDNKVLVLYSHARRILFCSVHGLSWSTRKRPTYCQASDRILFMAGDWRSAGWTIQRSGRTFAVSHDY